MSQLSFPLSNIQMELLKIYSTGLSDEDVIELKTMLAGFYAAKAIKQADNIWNERKIINAVMDAWLNKKS